MNSMYVLMYKLLYLFPYTHALIQFLDEDATPIVPISKLKEQELRAHVLLHGATRSSMKLSFYVVCNYTIDFNSLSMFYL